MIRQRNPDEIASAAGVVSIADIAGIKFTEGVSNKGNSTVVNETLALTFKEILYGLVSDIIDDCTSYTMLPLTPDTPMDNSLRTVAIGRPTSQYQDRHLVQHKSDSIFTAATKMRQWYGEVEFLYFLQLDYSKRLWIYICPDALTYNTLQEVAEPKSLWSHIQTLRVQATVYWKE